MNAVFFLAVVAFGEATRQPRLDLSAIATALEPRASFLTKRTSQVPGAVRVLAAVPTSVSMPVGDPATPAPDAGVGGALQYAVETRMGIESNTARVIAANDATVANIEASLSAKVNSTVARLRAFAAASNASVAAQNDSVASIATGDAFPEFSNDSVKAMVDVPHEVADAQDWFLNNLTANNSNLPQGLADALHWYQTNYSNDTSNATLLERLRNMTVDNNNVTVLAVATEAWTEAALYNRSNTSFALANFTNYSVHRVIDPHWGPRAVAAVNVTVKEVSSTVAYSTTIDAAVMRAEQDAMDAQAEADAATLASRNAANRAEEALQQTQDNLLKLEGAGTTAEHAKLESEESLRAATNAATVAEGR